MNILACRACRRPLTDKEGCQLCGPIRRHLVVVGEREEEAPSLFKVSSDAVRSLQEQVRHYAKALKAATQVDDQEKYRALQRSVAGALSKLLDSARKLQQDGVDAIEAMTFPERAKLFVDWYLSLPGIYRDKLRSEMDKSESAPAETVQ